MKQTRRELYSEAIGSYGYDNQAVQAIEEMAELIKALNKFRRNISE